MRGKYVKTFSQYENGYGIFMFEAEADEKMASLLNVPIGSSHLITIVGYNLPTTKVEYDFSGVWEKTEKYGYRFKAEEFVFMSPNNKEGILELLRSPMIKNIGPKTADKIYEKFGDATLQIIEYDYMQLTAIRGINEKKAESIHHNFMECKGVNNVFKLIGNAFTFKQATKIYAVFKETAEQVIKEDPYKLTRIQGVSFQMADALGKKYLNKKEFPNRVLTAATSILLKNISTGSSGIFSQNFIAETIELLNKGGAYSEKVDIQVVMKIIGKACTRSCDCENENKLFILQENYVFLKQYAETEDFIAKKIKYMLSEELHISCDVDLDESIREFEAENNIVFDEVQKIAIEKSFRSNISIITGGPGTGKSTIVKAILSIQKKTGKKDIVLLAPTGRAAKRLSETTGEFASTIHSALYIRPDDDGMVFAEEEPLIADLIVVDEMSMTDMFVMKCLCQNIDFNTRLILVGDSNQLPSVGPGNVLHDLISSGVIPYTELKSIFRQDEGSMIVNNAMKIKNGEQNICSGSDFFIIQTQNSNVNVVKIFDKEYKLSKAVGKTIDLYIRAIKKYGIDEVALLVPYRKQGYCTSVKNLNPLLQYRLNQNLSGPYAQVGDTRFFISDRVMQTKNINVQGESGEKQYISNGEIGYVTHVNVFDEPPSDDSILLYVKYDDVTIGYTKEMLQHLELAYCCTVHKSQGMEYKCVLLLIMEEHAMMLKRRVIYTGVTRGKECVCLIGEKKAISLAIQNNNDEMRKTLLSERLKEV